MLRIKVYIIPKKLNIAPNLVFLQFLQCMDYLIHMKVVKMLPNLNNVQYQCNQINNHKTDIFLLVFQFTEQYLLKNMIMNLLNICSFKFTVYAELYIGAPFVIF